MNEKDKKYNPSDKFNWGSGDFAVVLEPHETKGLSDREIVQLMDERERALKKSETDNEE